MGSLTSKLRPDEPASDENQSAEAEGTTEVHEIQPSREPSPDVSQMTTQIHCVEDQTQQPTQIYCFEDSKPQPTQIYCVEDIVQQPTPEGNEGYNLGQSQGVEGQGPQEASKEGSETPSLAKTSKVVCGTSEEGKIAPEIIQLIEKLMVSDAPSTRTDIVCQSHQEPRLGEDSGDASDLKCDLYTTLMSEMERPRVSKKQPAALPPPPVKTLEQSEVVTQPPAALKKSEALPPPLVETLEQSELLTQPPAAVEILQQSEALTPPPVEKLEQSELFTQPPAAVEILQQSEALTPPPVETLEQSELLTQPPAAVEILQQSEALTPPPVETLEQSELLTQPPAAVEILQQSEALTPPPAVERLDSIEDARPQEESKETYLPDVPTAEVTGAQTTGLARQQETPEDVHISDAATQTVPAGEGAEANAGMTKEEKGEICVCTSVPESPETGADRTVEEKEEKEKAVESH